MGAVQQAFACHTCYNRKACLTKSFQRSALHLRESLVAPDVCLQVKKQNPDITRGGGLQLAVEGGGARQAMRLGRDSGAQGGLSVAVWAGMC